MTKTSINDVINRFPKKRPPLESYVQKIHIDHYKKNRSGATPITSIAQKLERWLHIRVAEDAANTRARKNVDTLEIGAGNLNHIAYEFPSRIYDIVEPFNSLYEGNIQLGRVTTIYSDVAEIPISKKYDRIITIATLEHVLNLPDIIAKSALHLKPEGIFRAAIPNEGTFLWNLAWRCTTGIEFRLKYGVDYGLIMAHEHVNTALEVKTVLSYFFKNVHEKYFGIHSKLALYVYYECSSPHEERCINFHVSTAP